MKQLIYCCLFGKKEYIEIAKVFLESISLYSGIQYTNTDILIITTDDFKKELEEYTNKLNIPIYYYIKPEVDYYSRLTIFSYDNIENYNKILYLDLDCIILNNIQPLFDIIKDDKIYTCIENENSKISNNPDKIDWHGKKLFEKYNISSDVYAFSSGIILFNYSEKVENLFLQIIEHIETDKLNNNLHEFYDQPYIVFNAYKNNLVDCETISNFIFCKHRYPNKHNCPNIDICIIQHLRGNTGYPGPKLHNMKNSLSYVKATK